MKKLLLLSVFAGVLFSCSKDTFETAPTVKIDSFGPNEVTLGNLFRLVATVTDKEGDIRDSALLIVRKIYLTSIVNVDTIRQDISKFGFPQKDKLQLEVTFAYGRQITGTLLQNYDGAERPISLGLVVVDNAGHRSQYVESDKIILKKL